MIKIVSMSSLCHDIQYLKIILKYSILKGMSPNIGCYVSREHQSYYTKQMQKSHRYHTSNAQKVKHIKFFYTLIKKGVSMTFRIKVNVELLNKQLGDCHKKPQLVPFSVAKWGSLGLGLCRVLASFGVSNAYKLCKPIHSHGH